MMILGNACTPTTLAKHWPDFDMNLTILGVTHNWCQVAYSYSPHLTNDSDANFIALSAGNESFNGVWKSINVVTNATDSSDITDYGNFAVIYIVESHMENSSQ